jgi:mono/diheme cytochrome c family protein
MKKVILFVIPMLLLAACASQDGGMGPGMGGNGMMERHHAEIPAGYAGLTNPIPADTESLERGSELYTVNCASCHGDGGMGDGPAGSALDPAPSPIAHSSQMMADDYLFWRISEGGVPFGTSMPAWTVFDEQSRWDLVNYMRALGDGTVQPVSGMGGAAYDPEIQAAQQAEILAKAVEQDVITEEEAGTFTTVHDAVEQYRIPHPEVMQSGGNATEREAMILAALVEEEIITQAQADAFTDIHDRLGNSGLMP